MAKAIPTRSYAPRHLSLKEKHAFYVEKSDNIDECWPWIGGITKGGYGTATNHKKGSILAHRLSYIVNVGPIPKALCVLHKCDNRRCQNPRHLFLGTYKDNVRDMYEKGRNHDFKGERNPRAKITPKIVRAIRKATGAQWRIGEKYGVNQSTVSAICRRATWAHVL